MLDNHIKLTLRSFAKNKLYVAINVIGLAVAVAACLLIFRLVNFELSFNKNYKHYDRIYRVATHDFSTAEGDGYTSGVPIAAFAPMRELPQFEHFAKVHQFWPTIMVPNAAGQAPKKYLVDGDYESSIFTEPSFFSIFDWKWLAGDPSVLEGVNNVVLDQHTAEVCFGSWQQALGKTLLIDNLITATVRGVVENAPENSDFPFNLFLSYETIKKHPNNYNYNDDWNNTSSNDNAYALLRNKADEAAAQQLIAQIGQERYTGRVDGDKRNHYLQPLSQMHYDDNLNTPGDKPIVAKSRLGILALIGGLIAAMACFNFINLATAQSTSRSREVGVRKALGSTRNQLLRQFMSETGLIVLFSIALGLGIALFTKPLLKHISFVPDEWPFLTNPVVWIFLAGLALIVTLLAGFYPAMLLSRFEAINALKNNTSNKVGGGGWLRKGLVVAQFTIAQALIVCTLVAISQMDYIKNLDLGYKPDLVQYHFLAYEDSATIARLSAYKQRLQQIPGVEQVSFSSDVPSSQNTWSSNFAYGRGAPDAPFNISLKFFDADYCSTYGIKIIAGRNLQPSDTMREVLVNQTTLRKLGINNPEEALNKEIKLGNRRFLPIVGVVEDFHSKSVHQELEPLLMSTRRRFYTIANTKISGNNIEATTAQIRHTFDETFPEQYFDSQFLDESIATFYRTEDRFVQLCKGFAFIAILISCLGLYGLASLMAVQRTREIGVRKVLGATAQSIVQLMSKDFLRLVLIASLIGIPLAWYAMHQWLQDFVFRTPISTMVFIVTIAVSMLAAFLAISIQTLRAAQLDPVKSLRTE